MSVASETVTSRISSLISYFCLQCASAYISNKCLVGVLGVSFLQYMIVCTLFSHVLSSRPPGSFFFMSHHAFPLCRSLCQSLACIHNFKMQLSARTKGFIWTSSVKHLQISCTELKLVGWLSNPLVVLWDHKDSNDLTSVRSTGTLNRGPNAKQKISFSRKFPFMKSRERLNKLDDDESFENGSNHRWQYLPCCTIPCFYNPFTPFIACFPTYRKSKFRSHWTEAKILPPQNKTGQATPLWCVVT